MACAALTGPTPSLSSRPGAKESTSSGELPSCWRQVAIACPDRQRESAGLGAADLLFPGLTRPAAAPGNQVQVGITHRAMAQVTVGVVTGQQQHPQPVDLRSWWWSFPVSRPSRIRRASRSPSLRGNAFRSAGMRSTCNAAWCASIGSDFPPPDGQGGAAARPPPPRTRRPAARGTTRRRSCGCLPVRRSPSGQVRARRSTPPPRRTRLGRCRSPTC